MADEFADQIEAQLFVDRIVDHVSVRRWYFVPVARPAVEGRPAITLGYLELQGRWVGAGGEAETITYGMTLDDAEGLALEMLTLIRKARQAIGVVRVPPPDPEDPHDP